MVVRIEEIKDAGLTLTEPVSQELLTRALTDDGEDTGFKAVGPAPAKLKLIKTGQGSVLIQGELAVKVATECSRCLTDVQQELPVRFALSLVPGQRPRDDDEGAAGEKELKRDRGEGESAGSFKLGQADLEIFDGKTIDLDPILREQVLLALPMHVYCREDCKGLCPSCGQNLNIEKCGCEPRAVDPRLSVLKNIKLN